MIRVLIKGAGDIATGIAVRLHNAGFSVMMTDIEKPTTVRRTVAFSQAVYDKKVMVEGIEGVLTDSAKKLEQALRERKIPVIIDPRVQHMDWYQPEIVIDAILAKKNLGTKLNDGKLVIGIGPGFVAGEDCHAVIESMRGHYLGRVIWQGEAIPNTATPGDIGGYSIERLIRATAEGIFKPKAEIGDVVEKGDIVAYCGKAPVYANMSGMVRGMLQQGLQVRPGMKCGDIDPRIDCKLAETVSDKARAIGGGVLEAIFSGFLMKNM